MKAAIRKGCERATREHPLRSSVVHPITRKNEQTSCGIRVPIIHVDFDDARGDGRDRDDPERLGLGERLVSADAVPADGIKAVKRFVIDRVHRTRRQAYARRRSSASVSAAPRISACIWRRWRRRGRSASRCADPEGAKIEAELSAAVNELGIGPQGLGGDADAFRRACRDRGDAYHDESRSR